MLNLIAKAILGFLFLVRLQEEEKLLSTQLAGYEEYRRQVRYRLIPYIW
ncbi:MAG: hypothetical protein J5I90_06700 [Caldilineales bacterium]|nr:hypothetical protein [Caldilineales bacterium]